MNIIDQTYQRVPVDSIQPYPRNARLGDNRGVARSIKDTGFFGYCVVQKSTGFILAGSHRWEGAKSNNAEMIPVLMVACDDATAERINLADNRLADLSVRDEAALVRVLSKVRSIENTGYSPAYFQSMRDAMAASSGDEMRRRATASSKPPTTSCRIVIGPYKADLPLQEYESLWAEIVEEAGSEDDKEAIEAIIRKRIGLNA